uniref:PDZ domain-containing protein n=1 Tax=Cyclophora tenuis TaxID=216820 RepID=A0A7S1GJI6_CYCTE|mmetsp:Transcript_204/g.320  ORF Transcript_204/g.320 Transcript_204/m.320 type:complete len:273 (+) Transcript_204:1066-1884(+)
MLMFYTANIVLQLAAILSTCGLTSNAFVPRIITQQQQRLGAAVGMGLDAEDRFPKAEIYLVTLEEHKPLGCRVEESLAHPEEKWVFVSKIVEGGFAESAGLEVGDVILGISGVFGTMEEVAEQGVDRVRVLVQGRPEEDPLSFQIVRGTSVAAEHEERLLELCTESAGSDKEIDDRIQAFLDGAYEMPQVSATTDEEEKGDSVSKDEKADELLDSMQSLWQEEIPEFNNNDDAAKEEDVPTKPKPRPWSSRSSPSGTYVRDPATGIMRNIDA